MQRETFITGRVHTVTAMSSPLLMDPDWNEIWKQRQELHESSKISDDPSHDWNRKENAERYDANARSEYDDRVKTTIASLDINPEFAGTGHWFRARDTGNPSCPAG